MRIHHLDCGTMCPLAGRLMGGGGGLLDRGLMVCHCLLIETARDGLVLVDTGYGTLDCAAPRRLGRGFVAVSGPRLDPAQTAHAQVRALGHDPADVRHVVVTHLDLDHAGGLPDFPGATVHLHRRELDAARARATMAERRRYRPHQFAQHTRWNPVSEAGDTWLGLPAVQRLAGLDADLALIPLHGHTRGHSGVVVRAGRGWLLHAGDAYFHHHELVEPRSAPPGVRLFQAAMQIDGAARHASQDALRRLHREHPEVEIVSAHDPAELARVRHRVATRAAA
ncbi:MAG: MBL fold metallo-hydrolase [Kofleriaceae bacterium]|nr:MBL fold metallo-hydrolase [Kofleriaceae bacterium]MCL4223031.1 MBL fold metallo-hydrolase [Myxococcales bacterium]